MNNDPRSHGLWEASAPLPPRSDPLEVDGAKADVVVIGAGFTGLSAALHLAEAGASVLVLEAQQVGFGGSGRNVGLVNAGMWVMPDELPKELGPVYGPRLIKNLGNGPSTVYELVDKHGIECQAVRHGTLHCAVGASGLADISERHRQWRALGAPVELLDADAIAAATGTTAYRGGLLDRRAGTIQPLAYVRGLAHAAVRANVQLFTHSPVLHVRDEQTHWSVHTERGRVNAEWVIVATNAYTESLWPQLQEELVRLPYFNMATSPLSTAIRQRILPNLEGAWDTPDVLSSFRFDAHGRLVFGSVGALTGAGLGIHQGWGRRALAKLFPELAGTRFEYEWYGRIGMTSNALPRFHYLNRKTVSFSGYNGRGIAPGTVLGRELAQLVTGRLSADQLSLPVSSLKSVPLKAVRESGYEVGAQLAHFTSARF